MAENTPPPQTGARDPALSPQWPGLQPRLRGPIGAPAISMAPTLTPARRPKQGCPPYSPGSRGWVDSSAVPPPGSSSLPSPAHQVPSSQRAAFSLQRDSPAQSHTPLLRDLTWVRWFGLEHHQPTSLSLARQRQAIRYTPASEGHQRLPRTLNHPASELGPTGLGQRDRDSLHTCPAPRHPTALPQGQDGPRSCKHLLRYTH